MEGKHPAVRQVWFVLNPNAGRGRAGRLQAQIRAAATAAAERACYRLEFRTTEARGDAEEIAREASAAGAARLVLAGGDGTLHEGINGADRSVTEVAAVPIGTGNDFARAAKLSRRLDEAIAFALEGAAMPTDLGVCGGRAFLNVAGCGFDAEVARRINSGYRLLRGTAAYLAAVVQALADLRPSNLRIEIDGEAREVRGLLCAVANGTSYGGGMRIAPEARFDDGLLDVVVVGDVGRLEFAAQFPRVFRGTHLGHPKVWQGRGRRVRIEASPPVGVLLDGEDGGETPAQFAVVPSALRFVRPA